MYNMYMMKNKFKTEARKYRKSSQWLIIAIIVSFSIIAFASVELVSAETSAYQENVKEDIVNIVDPNLKAAIQAKLGLAPEEEITQDMLSELTSLTASDVSNISGLEYAKNLGSLNIDGGDLSDLSPLEGLNLHSLAFYDTNVSDISVIGNMINLQTLRISDFRALKEGNETNHIAKQNQSVYLKKQTS